MTRNKMINGILLAGMLFCIISLIRWFIQFQEIHFKAIVVLISCLAALLKPGKALPPFEYYREHYDIITPNTFLDKNKSQMLRMGIYWFSRKRYKKAVRQFDKLLLNEDLLSKEVYIVNQFKNSCILK